MTLLVSLRLLLSDSYSNYIQDCPKRGGSSCSCEPCKSVHRFLHGTQLCYVRLRVRLESYEAFAVVPRATLQQF